MLDFLKNFYDSFDFKIVKIDAFLLYKLLCLRGGILCILNLNGDIFDRTLN